MGSMAIIYLLERVGFGIVRRVLVSLCLVVQFTIAFVVAAAASGRNHVTRIFIGSTWFVRLVFLDDQCLLVVVVVVIVEMSLCPIGTG